jgi:DNA-binding FadR family transcriptional regulator
MAPRREQFDFLSYLAQKARDNNDKSGDGSIRIPPLNELSEEIGISIASLREQLGVARALGLVVVRPRTGIRLLPFSFGPAVYHSLSYAIACDRENFDLFANLRRHVEANYWFEAVAELTAEDHEYLQELVTRACNKLNGHPVRVPHQEHRQLHMTIYGRLQNPFVLGIMEAYWDAYEKIGYSQYSDLDYLKQVWQYHRQIVEAICDADHEGGYQALLEHMALIDQIHGSKIE